MIARRLHFFGNCLHDDRNWLTDAAAGATNRAGPASVSKTFRSDAAAKRCRAVAAAFSDHALVGKSLVQGRGDVRAIERGVGAVAPLRL